MRIWRASKPGRWAFYVLFLGVLFTRVLVPTGYMPVAGPQGMVISLCTGMGAVKAYVPLGAKHETPEDPDSHGKKDSSCTFAAGLGHGLLVADMGTPPAVPALTEQRHGRAIADLTVHRLAAPPPPAQGPPALA